MERYPPIAEHGLIGSLQTAALVATDGTVDWFCCPRFDAPSVFASLLDRDRGGHFRIAPEGEDHVARQLYFPDTAILVTRFMTADGVGEVIDFMPVEDPKRVTDRHRLVRAVRTCSPRRPGSGGAGWPARPTGAAGGRWSTARPSPSSC
jgi:GH15 family glucan-1,4-alpha-glucosidase